MALIKCHECGKEVSTEAAACPSCGAKPKPAQTSSLKKKRSPIWLIIGALVIVGVIGSIFGESEDKHQDAKTPAAQATTPPPQELSQEEMEKQIALLKQEHEATEKRKNEMHPIERFSIAADVAKRIKASAHDPKSVKFEAAVSNQEGTIMCFEFRGKNAFGAFVKQDAIFINNKIISGSDNPQTWNKHCVGSGLVNVINGARRA
jgi:hypothetical protein